MENFKTLHENKQEIQKFWKKEKSRNIEEIQKDLIKLFERDKKDTENYLKNLDRFTNLKNGNMLEDIEGEYVLFSDILELFK